MGYMNPFLDVIDPTRTPRALYDQDAVGQGVPQANTGEKFLHEVLGHVCGDMLGGIVFPYKVAIDPMQNLSLLYLQPGSMILPWTTAVCGPATLLVVEANSTRPEAALRLGGVRVLGAVLKTGACPIQGPFYHLL